jgi:hypothetical protein
MYARTTGWAARRLQACCVRLSIGDVSGGPQESGDATHAARGFLLVMGEILGSGDIRILRQHEPATDTYSAPRTQLRLYLPYHSKLH